MNSAKPNDESRSIRSTEQIFKLHFISLIREKEYKNVTVTDTVERADYNRSTEDVDDIKYNRILP